MYAHMHTHMHTHAHTTTYTHECTNTRTHFSPLTVREEDPFCGEDSSFSGDISAIAMRKGDIWWHKSGSATAYSVKVKEECFGWTHLFLIAHFNLQLNLFKTQALCHKIR